MFLKYPKYFELKKTQFFLPLQHISLNNLIVTGCLIEITYIQYTSHPTYSFAKRIETNSYI
jgi:hypothetical protein